MVVGVGALQGLHGLCAALHDLRHCLRYPLLEVLPEEEEEEELVKATWGGGGWWGRGWLLQEGLFAGLDDLWRPRDLPEEALGNPAARGADRRRRARRRTTRGLRWTRC